MFGSGRPPDDFRRRKVNGEVLSRARRLPDVSCHRIRFLPKINVSYIHFNIAFLFLMIHTGIDRHQNTQKRAHEECADIL